MKLPVAYAAELSPHWVDIRIICNDNLDITSIPSGVVFILAKWSGASQVAFRALNNSLTLSGVRTTLYVVGIDTDVCDRLFEMLGEVPSGTGETYWVLDGKVKHKLRGYNESSVQRLAEYTRGIVGAEKGDAAR